MAKRYGHIGNQALRAAADVLGRVKLGPASLKKPPKSMEMENAQCSKRNKGMAPQVGLEPTTLRLTGG